MTLALITALIGYLVGSIITGYMFLVWMDAFPPSTKKEGGFWVAVWHLIKGD